MLKRSAKEYDRRRKTALKLFESQEKSYNDEIATISLNAKYKSGEKYKIRLEVLKIKLERVKLQAERTGHWLGFGSHAKRVEKRRRKIERRTAKSSHTEREPSSYDLGISD